MKCLHEVLIFSSAFFVLIASALPTLIERQEGVWNGASTSNIWTAAGAAITGIGGTLLNFVNPPSALLDRPTLSTSFGEGNQPEDDSQGPTGSPAPISAVKECSPGVGSSCTSPLRMVIFPLSSCDIQKNKAITSKLKAMVGDKNVLTSKNSNCPGTKPGVMLWVAKQMTRDQMETLLRDGDVASISPDGPLKADAGSSDGTKVALVDTTQLNLDQGNLDQNSAPADFNSGSFDQGISDPGDLQANSENSVEGISSQNDLGQGSLDQWKIEQDNPNLSRKKRSNIKKRASVVVQQPVGTELAFVSTPPKTLPSDYAYFDNAGKGVTVYLIADGLQSLNNELTGRVKDKWIYTVGVPQTQLDPQGSGTCIGSIIVGKEHGVAKEAKLVVVKIDSRNWSTYFDAFGTIIGKLQKKVKEGEKVAGYTIVATSGGWHSNDVVDLPSGAAFEFKQLINILVNELQVVLVAAAGDDFENDNSESNTYPAAYSSDQVPMITVGALDPISGQKTPWAQGGSAVSIYAPGLGSCAANGAGNPSPIVTVGSSLAMAHTAGLAAYFLSLADVGNMIKQNANIPRALRNYIVEMGYNRVAGVLGIWNGLSPNPGPGGDHGWVP